MSRIKMSNLEAVVSHLNRITGSPMETWRKTTSGLKANVGNYHLSGAYGGWKLEQIVTETGAVKDVLGYGYTTKRELYLMIQSYIHGIDEGPRKEDLE